MPEPTRTLLVTGATGFIGASVVEESLQCGFTPIALVRPNSNTARLQRLAGVQTRVIRDWFDPTLSSDLQRYRPLAFVHCGWRGVGGLDRDAPFQLQENVPMTLASIWLARGCGCRQWVGLGSQAEYGCPNRRIDETAPTQPTTLYGAGKLTAGLAGLGLCRSWGMIGTWLRVFSVYGPGETRENLISHAISELLAGRAPQLTRCEQLWDYLYVTDAARAVIAVIRNSGEGVFNLGSGSAPSLRQTVELLRELTGAVASPEYGATPYRPDQVMHLQADVRRLREVTGWEPQVPLRVGLGRCVEEIQRVAAEMGRPRELTRPGPTS